MTHCILKTEMEMSYFNKLKNTFQSFKDFSSVKVISVILRTNLVMIKVTIKASYFTN